MGRNTNSDMRLIKKNATTMPVPAASKERMMRFRNSSRCSRNDIRPSRESSDSSGGRWYWVARAAATLRAILTHRRRRLSHDYDVLLATSTLADNEKPTMLKIGVLASHEGTT